MHPSRAGARKVLVRDLLGAGGALFSMFGYQPIAGENATSFMIDRKFPKTSLASAL